MADHCANCGSTDVQARGDNFNCLTCQAQTDYSGALVTPPPEEPSEAPKKK